MFKTNNKITGRIILATAIFTLIFSSMTIAAGNDPGITGTTSSRQVSFTHTVFAEDITAGWCVYCPSASENLMSTYNDPEFDGNFYFVSMITEDQDGNTISDDAQARANEYQLPGYPDVFFDGGYEEVVGGQSDDSNYRAAVESCAVRAVPDLDMDLTAVYEVDQKIKINIIITNNEDNDYSGNLRIYITEIESRYIDYENEKYPFGFLDYAINEDISIATGESYEDDITWDSLTAIDGQGEPFGIPDKNNIMVFATVFNSQPSPKARVPPGKPYIAHYADETAASTLGTGPSDTTAPSITIKQPKDGDQVSGNVDIIAEVTDDYGVDSVTYRIGGTGTPVTMSKTGTGDEYRASWDSTKVNDGNVVIQVEAQDTSSNRGQSSITVNVQNSATPDTTPPSIVIQAPTDSQTVSGTILVRAMVTDDRSVKSVEYQVDGNIMVNMYLSSTSNVYEGAWNTANVNDGTHTLQVLAEDYSANSNSDSIVVTVSNGGTTVDTDPPELYVRSPKNGDILTGEEEFVVVASDPSGISKVEYSLISFETAWHQMTQAGPDEWERTFNSLSYSDGEYSIMFRATDTLGNSETDTLTINIQNEFQDNINPELKILLPANGDVISGSVEITVEASDSNGIRNVQYKMDDETNWLQMINSRNRVYVGTLDTTDYDDGSHILSIQAVDEYENKETINLEIQIANDVEDTKESALPGFTGLETIIATLIIILILGTQIMNIRRKNR